MAVRARRILYVIAPERFRDEELAVPKRALESAGHEVSVASTRPGEAVGMRGALEGRRATTFPTDRAIAELKRGGATYVKEPVVRDGTIITASGPEAAEAFGAALVQLMGT